jgi:hypothetical protein
MSTRTAWTSTCRTRTEQEGPAKKESRCPWASAFLFSLSPLGDDPPHRQAQALHDRGEHTAKDGPDHHDDHHVPNPP